MKTTVDLHNRGGTAWRRILDKVRMLGDYPPEREAEAPLREDRANVFQALGMEADPWQKDLLRSTAPKILVCCSRQSGKSQTAAGMALNKALLDSPDPATGAPATVLIVSRALRQSAELLRKVKELYRGLRGERTRRLARWQPRSLKGEVAGYDDSFTLPSTREEAVQDSVLSLEFTNGARVISLPGSSETIVGYSAISLLVIDEAARTPDELYRYLRPMRAVSLGQMVCLSSPFGKRGWFFDSWSDCEQAKGRGEPEPWQRFCVTADDCPRISRAFLEDERREIGDRWFRQEYYCSFEDTVDAVFATTDIQAALSGAVEGFGFA
jgi:hypothetical protein